MALLGCGKLKSLTGGEQEAGAISASASAATAGSAAPRVAAAPGEDAVCTVVESKVWGKWVNQRTGITPRKLGNKLALGVALGNRPHIVVFDAKGQGRMVRPKPYAGSPLATKLKNKKSRRDLQRVTPVRAGGITTAYADYRDKHADGRRRIACELVSERKPVLLFDGTPAVKRAKKEAEDGEAKPAAKASPVARSAAVARAVVKGRLKLPKRSAPGAAPPAGAAPAKPAPPAGAAPAPPAGAAPAKPAPAPAPPKEAKKEKTKPLREIRDCRTFVDDDGEVWGVGSELYGAREPAGIKWSMRTFVAPNAGRGYIMLDSHALPKEPRDPKDLHTLESAVGVELGGDEHAVFGRYRGSLFGYHLDKNYRLRGGRKSYRGGYPSLPRFFSEGGDTRVLMAQKVARDRWQMRYGPLNRALPRSLEPIKLEGPDTSFAEPTLAKLGSQRWLAYHRGDRRRGQLEVVPVDEALAPAGKPFGVTPENDQVSESHLFALSDDRLLVVYIAKQNDVPVLTSEILSCSVKA